MHIRRAAATSMGKHRHSASEQHARAAATAAPAPSGGGGGAPSAAPEAATTPPPGAVHVIGAQLEGGGQILRNAAAIAAVTRRPVFIDRIRAGRQKPGLSPQHLTGLQLVAEMSGGALDGAAPRSTAVAFTPQALRCGAYTADTGTAGSCTLMVQQALPCCLFASPADGTAANADAARWTRLELRGGTDAAFAPPIGYLEHVLAPALRSLLGPALDGLSVAVRRRGFYPRGGGRVEVAARALAPGAALPAFDAATRGRLAAVRVAAFSAGRVPHSDAQRMAAAAVGALQDALDGPTGRAIIHGGGSGGSQVGGGSSGSGGSSGGSGGAAVAITQDVVREGDATAAGDGGGLLLVATSDAGRVWGASALWERGVPPGAAGRAAAEELLAALASGATVDGWLEDQLIVWMALAEGASRFVTREPSLHTRTAIAVATQMLPGARFRVAPLRPGQEGGGGVGESGGGGGGGSGNSGGDQLYLIECRGAGVRAPA